MMHGGDRARQDAGKNNAENNTLRQTTPRSAGSASCASARLIGSNREVMAGDVSRPAAVAQREGMEGDGMGLTARLAGEGSRSMKTREVRKPALRCRLAHVLVPESHHR